jgi:hypothetical protein
MPLDKIQTFKIDPRDAERLEQIATARGVSVGEIIREAIRDAISGPAYAMEVLENAKKRVEAEYVSRFAILETAKAQVENRIQTLSEELKTLTERKAELLKLETATDDPKKAMAIRKEYAETQDLQKLTAERLEQTKQKLADITQNLKQLEREKDEALNEMLRQAFPQVCEPLLDGLANRLANVAIALEPYLQAFASPATPERVLARFLWNRLGEMVQERSPLARDLIGRPSPLLRANYASWPAFWKHWATQAGYKTGEQQNIEVEEKIEEEQPEARISIEI